ncbi:MAG: phosphoribosylformylglycinamidine cyclo-ligase [Phycisphaerae bacterium]|nr:phosphoribosylformylglycinamidine cyclo-ligase [Phycisphaerae bacterium]
MAKTTTYKNAGVNQETGARWATLAQSVMNRTDRSRVCNREGSFAGLFRLDFHESSIPPDSLGPVLAGSADGVGTKVLLAGKARRLGGLGIDLVAVNVNDLVTCGAKPLFFLDYLAVHEIDTRGLLEIAEGMADGCRQACCTLLGGETAQMPDMYRKGHLDLAGFAVGVVQANRIIDGTRTTPGDILIGLPSNGIHSNGYTLVRRLITEHRLKLHHHYEELGETLADAVLRPTRIYVAPVLRALSRYRLRPPITAMAHITGGGLSRNIARMLPPGCSARLDTGSWQPPEIFPFIQKLGISRREMFRVFNMGIGFVLAVKPRFVAGVAKELAAAGESPIIVGQVTRGESGVRFESAKKPPRGMGN